MNYPNTEFQQALEFLHACISAREWVGSKSYVECKETRCPDSDWKEWLAFRLPKGKEEAQLALYAACYREDKDAVSQAVAAGADPNAQDSYALVVAAENNNLPAAELLIKHGADPRAWDSQALVRAERFGHTEMASLIRQAIAGKEKGAAAP